MKKDGWDGGRNQTNIMIREDYYMQRVKWRETEYILDVVVG